MPEWAKKLIKIETYWNVNPTDDSVAIKANN